MPLAELPLLCHCDGGLRRMGGVGPTPHAREHTESALDRVADVFDRLANLAAALPDRFLSLSRRFVHLAFVSKPLVVGQIASRLFQATLRLIDLALRFILIPHESVSSPQPIT